MTVKTVIKCGQIFLLACRQLQKKGQLNFIEQLKKICDVGLPNLDDQYLRAHVPVSKVNYGCMCP